MSKPLYGLIFGRKSNPLEYCKKGYLVLYDTEQEAQKAGEGAHVRFHVVPVDLETALRKNGNLSALAVLQLEGTIKHFTSTIIDYLEENL